MLLIGAADGQKLGVRSKRTPIAWGMDLSLKEVSDQTIRAEVNMCRDSGGLMIRRKESSSSGILVHWINAPPRLIFWILPDSGPVGVITVTGHVISTLGWLRFSTVNKIPSPGRWLWGGRAGQSSLLEVRLAERTHARVDVYLNEV